MHKLVLLEIKMDDCYIELLTFSVLPFYFSFDYIVGLHGLFINI